MVKRCLPRLPVVATIAGVLFVVLGLAGCTTNPAEVVLPGPAAAAPKAVNDESRPVTLPLPAPLATCTNAPPGWSLRENRRPGVHDIPPHKIDPGIGEVSGYLDSFTAVCGQTLSVHLSARHGPVRVRLRALRIGDYHGRGSRLVWQSAVLTAHTQEQAVPTGPERVIAEKWAVATTIRVNTEWPPGLYLIEIAPVEPTTPPQIPLAARAKPPYIPVVEHMRPSFIPLVVRTSGVRAPFMVVASDLTWLAYNEFGGRSLYFGPGKDHAQIVANRSYAASANRPVDRSGLRTVFTMTLPLVRFLARAGLAYDVTTDSSLDATPSQLVGQPTVLIGGHSEYWTKRMYDAAVLARNAGTNFAFLGANQIYWQGRIERDRSGRETALTVYRDSTLDHLAEANPATTTVQWRHRPLTRDPAALVGEGMSVVGVRGPFVVSATPAWLFAGTHLLSGDVLGLAVGNEADAQEPPGGLSPANLQVILHGVAAAAGETKPSLITAGYYTAPSGAGVFAAGTTYWVCDLDSTCPNTSTPPATSTAIQRITLNLLRAFEIPRAGRLHPSVGTPFESAAQLASQLPLGSGGQNSESIEGGELK